MFEVSLLKALLDKEVYQLYRSYLSFSDFPKELTPVVQAIDELHKISDQKVLSPLDVANVVYARGIPDKNKEYLSGVFTALTSHGGEETIGVLLDRVKKRATSLKMAVAAMNYAEGRGSIQEILSLAKILEEPVISEEIELVTDNLQEILSKLVHKPGLRWRLSCLNKSLGSLRKGNFGFIFARPECFTPDTEVLTPDGWLSVAEVTMDTEISAVTHDLTLKFEKPTLVTKRDDFDHVYHIYNRKLQMDIVVSPGHRMVYTKDNEWYEETAENIKYCQGKKSHTSTKGMGSVSILTPQERLGIAFQADGRARVYETHGDSDHRYGYEFTFTSERKIKRMRELLAQSPDVLSTEWVDSKGYTGFYLKTNHAWDKDFSWVTLGDKSFVWCREFAEELKLWDGSERSETSWKYSNGNKVAIDKAQAVVAMSGYNSFLSVVKDKRGYPDCYELHIRSDYTPVDGQNVIKEKLPNKESLYCFSVSTGMLLVRRNGKVLVCGNTGKTTFLASEVTHMASQLKEEDGPILWLNNEEQGDVVRLRQYQAALGARLEHLKSRPERAYQAFKEKTKGKIFLVDSPILTKDKVSKLAFKYKPSLIVVDQLDKVSGFESDREDLKLGSIYQWARELAKEYCPVIGVCQADGTAEGVKYLTMGHVSNAKTAKQAEADWILGIGRDNSPGYDYVRFLSILKNKLVGDDDTDQNLRHAQFQVEIQPEIARYRDLE